LRLRIAALALAGLAAAAAPVHAKSLTPQAFIEQWDADHDGTLSLDEVKKAASARFDELDRHHDGTLDKKELSSLAGRILLRLFGPTQAPLF